MEYLKGQLLPRHKAAARMRIEGRPNPEICSALGIKPKTLWEWMSDDKVREYMRTLSEHVEREFASRLAEAGMKGLSTIMELLDRDLVVEDAKVTADDKLKLAIELMDRLPATMTNRDRVRAMEARREAETEQATKLTQVFLGMDDTNLLHFLSSGSDSNGNGPPVLPPADA